MEIVPIWMLIWYYCNWFLTGVDIIPFFCTLVACLTYSIEFGIIIGIAINISFVLYDIARPVIHVYNRKVGFFDIKFVFIFIWQIS